MDQLSWHGKRYLVLRLGSISMLQARRQKEGLKRRFLRLCWASIQTGKGGEMSNTPTSDRTDRRVSPGHMARGKQEAGDKQFPRRLTALALSRWIS